jgi:hypothetical protein
MITSEQLSICVDIASHLDKLVFDVAEHLEQLAQQSNQAGLAALLLPAVMLLRQAAESSDTLLNRIANILEALDDEQRPIP